MLKTPGKARKIMEPATGAVWKSVAALEREVDLTFPTIVRRIKRGKPIDGRTFVFVDRNRAEPLPDLRRENASLRREIVALRKDVAALRSLWAEALPPEFAEALDGTRDLTEAWAIYEALRNG